MRLACKTSVENRALHSLNVKCNSKSVHSSVAIGCKPGCTKEIKNLYIQLNTAQNLQGVNYKIESNISNIFSKFLSDGKLTLRFIKPEHDLIILGDSHEVKRFYSTLIHILRQKRADGIALAAHGGIKSKQILKLKLEIKSRNEYPIKKGFPSLVHTLIIKSIDLNRIEHRICALRNLQELDLSNNKIENIPDEVSDMKSLKKLNLSQNNLKTLNPKIFEGCLKQNLDELVLSHNELSFIPHNIKNMKQLATLKVDNNNLLHLPFWIGYLPTLQELDASSNLLGDLPPTTTQMSLQALDISDNPFKKKQEILCDNSKTFPTLQEITACAVIKMKKKYDPVSLPRNLCTYLGEYFLCACGKILFEKFIFCRGSVNPGSIARLVRRSSSLSLPCLLAFCSYDCSKKHLR